MAETQHEDAAALASAMLVDDARKIWYFAYGSNMRASVMQNRGITALAKEIAVVPSHTLSFDVFGVPYSEPAMGSITSRKEANYLPSVHGVAYLVSHADYVRLLVSEGAGTAYKETKLDAVVIPTGKGDGNEVEAEGEVVKLSRGPTTIKVYTLVARYPFRPNAPPRPSRRYLVSRTSRVHKCPLDADSHLIMANIGSLNPRCCRAWPTSRVPGLPQVLTRLHQRHLQTHNNRRLNIQFSLATHNPAHHALD